MASLTTSARRDGGDLVINGTKMWITNGLQVKTRTHFGRTLSSKFYRAGGLGLPVGEHERGQAPPEQVADRGADGLEGDHQVCHLKVGNACGCSRKTELYDSLTLLQASDTTILTFEDVRVPVEHIIGEEGMGFTYQMIQFQVSVGIFDHIIQIGAASGNIFCFHIFPSFRKRGLLQQQDVWFPCPPFWRRPLHTPRYPTIKTMIS